MSRGRLLAGGYKDGLHGSYGMGKRYLERVYVYGEGGEGACGERRGKRERLGK